MSGKVYKYKTLYIDEACTIYWWEIAHLIHKDIKIEMFGDKN